MDCHKIDAVGSLFIEEVVSLPTWVSTYRRRIIFNYADNYMYFGGKTGWRRLLTQGELDDHITDYSNPHLTTTTLISAAPQVELDSHVNNVSNPHTVTLNQLGAAAAIDLSAHIADLNNPHQTEVGNLCTVYSWTSVGGVSWDIPANTRYIDITCVGGGEQTSGNDTGAAGNYSRTITDNITDGQTFTVTVGNQGGTSSFGSLCVATGGYSTTSGCTGDIKIQGGRGNIDTDSTDGREESEGAASFFGCAPAPGGGCSCHSRSVVTGAGTGIVIVEVYHS